MADLFSHFFWLIFPIMGMGMGAFAIWNEFSRQKKALEVLKIYAEKGAEPPASVMAVLNRASAPGGTSRSTALANPWARAAFFVIMSAGCVALALWFFHWNPRSGGVMGFGMAAFVMAALAAAALVTAFISHHKDGD
ncbi:MAG: hypothetical protein ABIO37_18190 [Caulobacteraceae bacterium]